MNPTVPTTSGAVPIAPAPANTPTPTAPRRPISEKFTKRYHPLDCNKEEILFYFSYLYFMK